MPSRNLKNNLRIVEVSPDILKEVLDTHFKRIYKNRLVAAEILKNQDAGAEIRKNRSLMHQRYELRLVAYDGDIPVGWHFGHSLDSETYYMQNSAVLENSRNQGVYGALLDAVLKKLKSDFFEVVVSQHHPNNAAVLIPKLKKGFVVSAMNFHEQFKLLIELKYFFNEDRRKAYGRLMGLDI